MVKEFTDLQGIVGGLYAKAQGEPEQVWRAVYDHYKPLSMEDGVPSTQEGLIVALADKLDTLRGCFAIGLVPTGSKDPFALRRAAQGVVKILVEGKQRMALSKLVQGDLLEFMLDRVRYYFREVRGFKYDEVNAVLALRYDDLVDVESRLKALQAVRPTENFEPLAASFKRIQNILKQSGFVPGAALDPSLLDDGPERDLHKEFVEVGARVQGLDYLPALEAIATLRASVDRFFDKVLVNAPDERVRQNRLTLLNGLLTGFSTIADFSEIVTQ
jgi:glycyl-tRNA synthetase beta chain